MQTAGQQRGQVPAIPEATPDTQEPILLYDVQDGVATLTLNRPRQYNALSQEMLAALQRQFDSIAAQAPLATGDALGASAPTESTVPIGSEPIRVVVIAANGKAFCAGHDLKEMRAQPSEAYYQDLFAQCSQMMLTINRLPQPVIAKVQGLATAAGCQLVAACDLAVAADTARFATSGINVGLFCSTPSVAVSRNLTRKRAFELLMTGEFIDAQTAQQWGLINRVAPAAELDDTVQQLVDAMLSKSFRAVASGKAMFYQQLEMGLASAYEYAGHVMACDMMARDAGEGIDAFIEKRPPVWNDR